jgi:hypothetical protein
MSKIKQKQATEESQVQNSTEEDVIKSPFEKYSRNQ